MADGSPARADFVRAAAATWDFALSGVTFASGNLQSSGVSLEMAIKRSLTDVAYAIEPADMTITITGAATATIQVPITATELLSPPLVLWYRLQVRLADPNPDRVYVIGEGQIKVIA